MNKICTSVEQSKKLIELGIDVNTADMCHRNTYSNNNFRFLPCADKAKEPITGDIPAWSLSALLELIPSSVFLYLKLVKWDESYYIEHREMLYDNPIDAAFEMIVWLKENGKL